MKMAINYLALTLISFGISTTMITAQNAGVKNLPKISFKTSKLSYLEPKDKDLEETLEITASGGTDSNYPIKIKVKVGKEGSAASSDYYFDDTKVLVIDKKDGSTTLRVTIKKDNDNNEADETFKLEIVKDDAFDFGENQSATITIREELSKISFKTPKLSCLEPKDYDLKIPLEITASGGTDSNYPIKFKVKVGKEGSAASSDFEFDGNSELKIDKKDGSTTLWVTIKKDNDDNEADETFKLEIVKDASYEFGENQNATITINSVSSYELVRLTTGVDFDFGTNDKPIYFYGELNGFMPDLFYNKRCGVSFKIFSNHFTNVDSMLSTKILNVQNGFLIDASSSDTMIPYRKIGLSPTKETKIRNYGVSFSPMYKLGDSGNASVHLAFLLEGLISSSRTTYKYDTSFIRNDTVSIQEFRNFSENKLIKSSNQDLFIGNFAITFPIRYVNDKLEIRITPGYGFSAASSVTSFGLIGLNNNANYYQLDVNVLDRNFGITIGGEIKSYFINGGNIPLVNIYIAKSFNFSKFSKFD